MASIYAPATIFTVSTRLYAKTGAATPNPKKQIRKALFRHTKGCTLDASGACSGTEWGNRATFS